MTSHRPILVVGCLGRNLFDYDQVVNTQRDRVYAERRRALLSDNLAPAMIEYAERTCDDILEVRTGLWLLQCIASTKLVVGSSLQLVHEWAAKQQPICAVVTVAAHHPYNCGVAYM
jgi:hypothetical protein